MENKSEKLKLPFGITDFADIRTGGYYYVDKTQFIEDYCNNYYHAGMITRPAYFGKSLCISMLQQFLEIGTDKSLFDGLYISQKKEFCDKYMGKFRVISINFKDVHAETYEMALQQINAVVTREVQRHHFPFENDRLSDEYNKRLYQALLAEDKEDVLLVESLEIMVRMLNEYYDDPVVLLVDDWDTPLFAALRYGYYDKIAYIIRRMVEMAVDGCKGLDFSLLTSSMHIPIGGGYFDSYNYVYRSIFGGCHEKMAGFTESETREILEYYGINDSFEELKQYCGEYRVGRELLFNPELVFEYVGALINDPSAVIQRQKTDGRERKIIELMMEQYAREFWESGKIYMQRHLNGRHRFETITDYVKYDGKSYVPLSSAIWSAFLMRGYMTADHYNRGEECWLSISNEKYKRLLSECLHDFQEKEKRRRENETRI